MKKIKYLFSFIFIFYGIFILASCGNNDDNKLPESNYEKVKYAFNGVENSIKNKTSLNSSVNSNNIKLNSSEDVIKLNAVSIDDNANILDDIFRVFESGDNQGNKAAEIEYSQPPMVQFRLLKALIDKSNDGFEFNKKFYTDIQGECYIDFTTGYRDLDNNIENKLNYNFKLSMSINIDDNDLITAEVSFNLNLVQGDQQYDTNWYVHMNLDYDMTKSTPNYVLTMVTSNDQDKLDYRLGYTYEYDYVEVKNNEIYEWRKFVLEADTKLIKNQNHQTMDSYIDDGVSIIADTCKWYKNSTLFKMVNHTPEKQIELSKKYFNLGLNSTAIYGEDFFNLNGTANNILNTVITEYKNNMNEDLIYSIICNKNYKEEKDHDEYTRIRFLITDADGNLILENEEPIPFDNRMLITSDIAISDTFKNNNIWAGDHIVYYNIFLQKKDGSYVTDANSNLIYKLVYNNQEISINTNDKLKDIFEQNNITKDENEQIKFKLNVSYPDTNLIASTNYIIELKETNPNPEPDEPVISGIKFMTADKNGYGTSTPFDDETLEYWLTNDIAHYVEGSYAEDWDTIETFEGHPCIVYVDQNGGFISFVDLSKTVYSVEFKIDDEYVTVDTSLKFSEIIALYGFNFYDVRAKIGDYYTEDINIRLYDYRSRISENYYGQWPTFLFLEYGYDEDLIPPEIDVTYNVSEYGESNPFKKYLFENDTYQECVYIRISDQNDISSYIQTLEGLGYVHYVDSGNKEFDFRKSEGYIKTLDDGTKYVFEYEGPNNGMYYLKYWIKQNTDK